MIFGFISILHRYNFLLRNCYFYPIILGWKTFSYII